MTETLVMDIPHIIGHFRGQYDFLENLYPVEILYEHDTYQSAEAAFQAAKVSRELRKPFINNKDAGECKKLGRQLTIRKDWDDVRLQVMEYILGKKFEQQYFKDKLVNTKDFYLIRLNTECDNFWGFCLCKDCLGKPKLNFLGCILMKIRFKLLK